MKRIFLIITFGIILEFGLFNFAKAGTGPYTNIDSEKFWTERTIGNTSTIFKFHFPEINNFQYSATWGIVRGNIVLSPTLYPCYYAYESYWLQTNSGSLSGQSTTLSTYNSTSTDLISVYFTINDSNIAPDLPNTTSSPLGILNNCPTFINSSSSWTNNYWDIDTLEAGQNNTRNLNSTGTIDFIYPREGLEVQDPDNWVVALYNVNPLEPYYIWIGWSSKNGNNPEEYHDVFSTFIPETIDEGLIPIDKKYSFFSDLSSTSTNATSAIHASVFLTQDPNWASENIIATDEIYFTASKLASTSDDTATRRAGENNRWQKEADNFSRLGSEYSCGNAPPIYDIANGIPFAGCKIFKFLLYTDDRTISAKVTEVSENIQKIFPLSYVFRTYDEINNVSSSISDKSPTLYLDMRTAFNNSNAPNFVLLSSSSLSNPFGSYWKNQLFDIQKYIFWLFALAFTITNLWPLFDNQKE